MRRTFAVIIVTDPDGVLIERLEIRADDLDRQGHVGDHIIEPLEAAIDFLRRGGRG